MTGRLSDDYDYVRETAAWWREQDELDREQVDEWREEQQRYEPLPNQIPLLPRRP